MFPFLPTLSSHLGRFAPALPSLWKTANSRAKVRLLDSGLPLFLHLGETNGVDRRQVVAQAVPGFSPVFGKVDIAGRRTEGERIAGEVEGMAEDDVVGVRLRQALAVGLPGL